MDLQLKGKKALITGSTAGIGFATAALLLQEGAEVVINGRSRDRVNKASPLSSATNGAALRADGGVVKSIY